MKVLMRAWGLVLLVVLVAACNMPSPTKSPIATTGVDAAVQATLTAVAATPVVVPAQTSPVPQASPAAATPTLAPTASTTGQVEGMVWRDECTVEGGENGAPLQPGPNCKKYPGVGYGGDGVKQDSEQGAEGVEVRLAKGACPGTPWLATLTDAQGHYVFPDVPPGKYCVFIDPKSEVNGPLLIPGEWSYPAPKQGSQEVTVAAGQKAEANFGWFPSMVGFVNDCEQRAEFLSETVPDGSEMQPGNHFVKQWTVRNTGTCTWTTDYALVHVDGDTLGAPPAKPLPREVRPGEEITLELEFTAPQAPGTYRSEWQLSDKNGKSFGPGDDPADGRLWVEIKVPSGSSTTTLNPGTPTVLDPMDSPTRWYMLKTPEARFEMAGGRLALHGLTPGMVDTWALSSYPPLSDAYVEATFITGSQCSGLDRYGMIVRAPDPTRGVVVEFSCDGRYRVYIWDGSNFTSLKPWTHGASISGGPNQTNRMGVWTEGDTVKVYANRVLLAEVHQSQYTSGRFGLVIAAESTPDFTVFVDEVAYWSPLP